ncbi:hypothetical protein U9M48_019869 [Paspalum notatum var. saurae]|uniref:Reverse transcriptase Ty1/copia-type domain-containing protein n=1 Tax=Paspalum notatum var. saurae TaxID=547442 RepID=A0AAQ3WRM7_PASNO
MGEKEKYVEERPQGYRIKREALDDKFSGLVTLDRVWRLAEHGDSSILAKRAELRDLCLSYSLFKILRRRLSGYPVAEAGSAEALRFVLQGMGSVAVGRDRVFRVLVDELWFASDFYYSPIPLSTFGGWCAILDFLCSSLIVVGAVAVGLIYHNNKLLNSKEYYKIAITFSLLLALVLVEAWEIVAGVCSNWTKMALLGHYIICLGSLRRHPPPRHRVMGEPKAPSSALAIQSINIKSVIPFNLEFRPSNYSKWSELFSVLLRRFNLTKHVNGKGTATGDADWAANDSAVVSWIYGSVSDTVLGMIIKKDISARDLWVRVENLYRNNKKARILSLEVEFRSTRQGDLGVMDYCQRMKDIADSLTDLGHEIKDDVLVLAILNGLNDNFAMIKKIITTKDDDDFPDFLEARSLLLLDEAGDAKPANSATVFLSSTSGGSNTSSAPSAPAASRPPSKNSGKSGRYKGNKGGSNKNIGGVPGGPFFNPWTGTFQLWPGTPSPGPRPWMMPSPTPGILGRPPLPPPQANIATIPSQPSWDQAGTWTPVPPIISRLTLDLQTRTVIHRCNSSGSLYPVHTTVPAVTAFATSVANSTSTIWHRRLGHPGHDQNGRAERMIRSINNILRSIMFQAAAPPSYWAEALLAATSLINLLPTKTLHGRTPYFALLGKHPDYSGLRVFGCLCYPNLSATAHHKLAPRSAKCVLLGPPSNHKGYRCLDLATNRVITSRHLVPRPPHANVVSGKWVYRHKLKHDRSLDRYKARWVLRGFSQQEGIDFDQTFSPVIKPATIRVVLSLALAANWSVQQLDVKNAFLHGHLTETVYAQQPSGFVDSTKPDFVCRLNRSLYGLKQAPRAWFTRFTSFLKQIGFTASVSDPSLFIFKNGSDTAYLLLYVDDIILTTSSPSLTSRIVGSLRSEFSMTDMGDLHYFLGIAVTRSSNGFFLSQ